MLIHASYDNNALKSVELIPAALTENETVDIALSAEEGDKLMLWESLASMKPLCDAVSVESGSDIVLQYADWSDGKAVLTKNDVTGVTKVWSALSDNLRSEFFTESFYSVPDGYENYFPEGTLTINSLAAYKDRLYAGCDSGLVVVFTSCSKCYQLKKACEFDIKSMEIDNDVMRVSDGENTLEISMSALGGDSIEADEARLLAGAGAVLVDVRTAEEFAEKSVEGSVNIPVDTIETGLEGYSTDTVLIFYCVSGARAERAVEAAKALGFTNVYNLGSINKLI